MIKVKISGSNSVGRVDLAHAICHLVRGNISGYDGRRADCAIVADHAFGYKDAKKRATKELIGRHDVLIIVKGEF